MRIGFNTLSENPYAPSGAQGFYINLMHELSRVGKEHTFYLFVSNANQHLFGPYEMGNVQKIIFPHSNERKKSRVLTEHLGFAPIIRKHGIEVLNTGVAPLWCPCKLVVTMKTMHVYTNPHQLPLSTVLYRRMIYHWTIRRADAIIANSQSFIQDLKKYLKVPENKIKLVYEALDHRVFFPINDKSSLDSEISTLGIRRPFILFVSSLWPYKNAETLIEAFAAFVKRHPEYMLAIAGYAREESYFTKLTDLVRKHGIVESVVFTGGLPHDIVAKLYQTASVFVYPSFYETFGLTILEAMACGCPVITSNVSAMPEIADDAAIFFDPRRSDGLCDKIEKVVSDKTIHEELVSKGVRRAAEFTWEKTSRCTLDVLESV
jgi:glycosyltransferase involved in cell wall biosynthesis